MLITRTSIMSGIERTRDLDVTPEQLYRWQAGCVAQVAFAHLSPDEREFIMTGATQDEWDTLQPEDDV